ncbi:PEP-CTERM sorting domain-containing protein [Rugamonas sp. CCM 8940]|uniref:PEP-CTERM sorting domain-containing protein n=1 Tax=Rugamonas sp. CCM 8940 TaxID=2765359 RepID=UPI0018F422AB|nr:PEP-CTERM sorting domain-containing protein [Rugamonas sp. CCM 8940]MBJ7313914.1 PEP-CTERM sorting domain-containing protein [Rugamonas sp. CCM 8940]
MDPKLLRLLGSTHNQETVMKNSKTDVFAKRQGTTACAAFLLAFAGFGFAGAASAQPVHLSNGLFGAEEWTLSPSDGTPARPTVNGASFNVGAPNGTRFYVEQSSNGVPATTLGKTLNLMYDLGSFKSGAASGSPGLFTDVFFQNGKTDYVVHITGNTANDIKAFEKSNGVMSPVDAAGGFDLSSPIWHPLDAADLALAKFHAGASFGASPNYADSHLIIEFDLSVDTSGVGSSLAPPAPDGLYDPAPAFWSGSVGGQGRPTIVVGSAVFDLNSDGTTLVTPVLGPNGLPILQAVPEPSSVLLLAAGAIALLGVSRRGAKVPA